MADQNSTVYVGNVDSRVDEATLRAVFDNCGVITGLRVAGEAKLSSRTVSSLAAVNPLIAVLPGLSLVEASSVYQSSQSRSEQFQTRTIASKVASVVCWAVDVAPDWTAFKGSWHLQSSSGCIQQHLFVSRRCRGTRHWQFVQVSHLFYRLQESPVFTQSFASYSMRMPGDALDSSSVAMGRKMCVDFFPLPLTSETRSSSARSANRLGIVLIASVDTIYCVVVTQGLDVFRLAASRLALAVP